MASSALSNVQVFTEFKSNVEIDIIVPKVAVGPWELIDFAYHKNSALPVTLTLIWKLNGQVFHKIREEVGYIKNDLYFQINKDMQSDWTMSFTTVGATGNGFDHWVSMTYR